MKKVILSLVVMGAICFSSTAFAQDVKKDKAKTETTCTKKDSKACCADKDKKAADSKSCCADKKDSKTADSKSCCSAKKSTADTKSAGKK
jgi:hypothetical protein